MIAIQERNTPTLVDKIDRRVATLAETREQRERLERRLDKSLQAVIEQWAKDHTYDKVELDRLTRREHALARLVVDSAMRAYVTEGIKSPHPAVRVKLVAHVTPTDLASRYARLYPTAVLRGVVADMPIVTIDDNIAPFAPSFPFGD